MNPAAEIHIPKDCKGCPVWMPAEQTGVPTLEKIQACIQHVLGREGLWMTGEEFLANVAANRAARLKAGRIPRKPFKPGPFVREYRLWGGYWVFKPKTKDSIAAKPEVLP